MTFQLGAPYTRVQINAELGGGSVRSFLPFVDGRVVAGCFDPAKNHRAPSEIDVGDGPVIVSSARLLVSQSDPIPVFLKRKPNQWEYVGEFRATAYGESDEEIQRSRDNRSDVIGVLYLEEVTTTEPTGITRDAAIPISVALEGGQALVEHLHRERSRTLTEAKRRDFRHIHGSLQCEVCGLPETALPAQVGEACFEVHHLVPLALRTRPSVTRLDDLALVCANCHRMIHGVSPMLPLRELRAALERKRDRTPGRYFEGR